MIVSGTGPFIHLTDSDLQHLSLQLLQCEGKYENVIPVMTKNGNFAWFGLNHLSNLPLALAAEVRFDHASLAVFCRAFMNIQGTASHAHDLMITLSIMNRGKY